MRWCTPLLMLCSGACTCAALHTLDDAGPDAGSARDASPARRDAGPPGRCEDVFAAPDLPRGCTEPGRRSFCGLERCCTLAVECSAEGVLEPVAFREGTFHLGEIECTSTPVEPSCALSEPNAMLEVVIDGRSLQLTHAYADHGVGFATYLDLTFTTTGEADVCTPLRLGIGPIAPGLDASPAYVGEHEIGVQLFDEASVPPWRFASGRLVITESLGFREGGPVAGTLEVDDGGLVVTGSFRAQECEPWRTSGS